MRKMKLIFRESIINPETNLNYEDYDSLKILDGYREFMCTDVDCDIHTLINKIENENPEVKGWDCQIIQE